MSSAASSAPPQPDSIRRSDGDGSAFVVSSNIADAHGRRNPSSSQSFGSRLGQMEPRAARALASMLGRPLLPTPGPSAAGAGAGAGAGVSADGAAPAAPAPSVPSGPVYHLGASSFHQIPHASLSIDAGARELLHAFRVALLQSESRAARSELHARIAALFRSRPNVHATEEAAAAAAERARRPPLSVEAAADPRVSRAGSSFASPSSPSLASPVNANGTLPARLIAPAYLLAEHNIHTGLSARSCLDSWLSAMRFPRGGVVLLTAVNIPDISVVLRAHGLIPVPVDVEVDTLAPRMDLLERACRDGTAGGDDDQRRRRSSSSNDGASATASANGSSGRVVAILVAQLYGRRFDMSPIVDLARRFSLRVVEDLAESYSGLDHIGHPRSDLSLLSFGSIKVGTAFGGGVARVRDRAVWEEMRRVQEGLAVQSRRTFFSKCVTNTFAMLALNVPLVTGGLIRSGRQFNWDVKASVVSMMRGFPDRLMERLREQPSSALLAMLHYRLSNFDVDSFQRHQDKCDLLLDLLPSAPGVVVPGVRSPVRNHWLFPVVVRHVAETQRLLNDNGVDAYRGATQLALVPMAEGEGDGAARGLVPPPAAAADMMSRTLFLPMHRNVPLAAVVRMAAVMHRVIESLQHMDDATPAPTQAPTHAQGQAQPQLPSKL